MSDRRIQWLQRLRGAVLDAFPERTDLEQQLWFQLGVRLDEIAADSANLTDTVFELLKWSEAHGRTQDLVHALADARPDRDDLKQLLQEWPTLDAAHGGGGDLRSVDPSSSVVGDRPGPLQSFTRGRALAGAVVVAVVILLAFVGVRGLTGKKDGADIRNGSVAPPGRPAPSVPPASTVSPETAKVGGEARLSGKEVTALRRLMVAEPGRFRVDEQSQTRITFWPNGSTITVAFLDGSKPLQLLVKQLAAQWERYANVHFAFVPDLADSEVRVSFLGPRAYSHLGTDALAIDKREATAVLGGLAAEDDQRRAYTVLHEFGHVLGLIHELQNPNAENVVNWDVVYTKAAEPPNNWDRETVDQALRPPKDLPPAYRDKPFDPNSVMISDLPDDWLLDGLSITPGSTLSQGDRTFIARVYPK